MNTIEMLLKLDAQKIQLPMKEVEIKRLSELTGSKVVFKLQGIDSETMQNNREMAFKGDHVSVAELRAATIVSGVVEPNLRDKGLNKHFGAVTPYELVNKMLTPGEGDVLYEEINKLSGYNDGAVEEVKN